MKRFAFTPRSIIGIVILVLGGFMLLNSMGIGSFELGFDIIWPILLILFGIGRINDSKESTSFGIILTAIGGLYLLKNLGVPFFSDFSLFKFFWPVIIILIGLSLIFPDGFKNRS